MMGVYDFSRGWVPFSAIARATIRPGKHGGEAMDLRLHDGTRLEEFGPAREGFERLPVQLVPAEPGWQLCRIWFGEGDEGPGVGFSPIIAWAQCVDGEMRPVTPCGVNDGGDDPERGIYVRTPDGRIEPASSWGDGRLFEHAGEFLEHYVAEREAQLREASANA
ncbi:hypothetical protein Q9Q95_13435 [Sphingomonas sp. DG1-23]|uniref:hypothetical protein n=1 Tax=Sphingomonas sp. DG1-23 TaxID=3068316 RepID=UPI00273ED034|nr:hypothetical protein [Sphingomonas sp. DG1-23]MDP5279932.1 hypothetical protein [Sphingomonas sp. DG1-23]